MGNYGWTCGRCGGPVAGRYSPCSACGLNPNKVSPTERVFRTDKPVIYWHRYPHRGFWRVSPTPLNQRNPEGWRKWEAANNLAHEMNNKPFRTEFSKLLRVE